MMFRRFLNMMVIAGVVAVGSFSVNAVAGDQNLISDPEFKKFDKNPEKR